MPWPLTRTSRHACRTHRGLTPIGLDVGARLVKAVQLEPSRRGLRVTAAAVVPRAPWPEGDAAGRPPLGSAPVTAAEAAALADVLGRAGFSGRRVVLAAPSDGIFQSVLELPPKASQAPVDQLARAEIARSHKLAPDAFEMGYWDLPTPGRGSRGTQVMAVGLPHAPANAMLDAFESAGLRVDAMDVPACAVARACGPVVEQRPGGVTAVLDLGWGPASLSLLYQGTVVYGRVLTDAGVGRLHDALVGRLELDADVARYVIEDVGLPHAEPGHPSDDAGDANAAAAAAAASSHAVDLPDDALCVLANHVDAIASELTLSFSYATHQYSDAAVSRLLLVGGGARIPGLAARLSAAMGFPAVAVAPTDLATCDRSIGSLCGSPVLTAAVGLAQFPEV